MEEKKDLRVQKTEKAIREAFLEIRKKTPPEKVKVKDICQRAMINTSTFYNHYPDVLGLSDCIENELLKRRLEALPDPDCMFSDPYRFLTELRQSFSEEYELISILFNGREEVFYKKVEELLLARYCAETDTELKRTKVLFVLGGILYSGGLLPEDKQAGPETLYSHLAILIKKLQ